jgi:hypothetical protein
VIAKMPQATVELVIEKRYLVDRLPHSCQQSIAISSAGDNAGDNLDRSQMKPDEILHALTHASFEDEDPPRKALAAASRQRRRMKPIFLEEIETYLDASPKTQREQPTPTPFIMLLFAEWRETAAYRPLAKLLRCSHFNTRAELADALDVLAHPVMYSTFDGDPAPLYDLALDPEASMHTRAVIMTDTICALTIAGRIDGESAADFLIDAFERLGSAPPTVWDGWASLIASLQLSALRPLVQRAIEADRYDDSLFDYYDMATFDEMMADAAARPDNPSGADLESFGDVATEILDRRDSF